MNIKPGNCEEIKQLATIYKKETNRPLPPYQKKMNKAAHLLCLENPALLQKRNVVIEESHSKIISEGFQFVKGKSRSKRMANTIEQQQQ